jgi:hypothetical protein
MPNHMKFCGCNRCRSGLHTKSGGATVRKLVRKARRSTKQNLKLGKEPEPKISIEYTD